MIKKVVRNSFKAKTICTTNFLVFVDQFFVQKYWNFDNSGYRMLLAFTFHRAHSQRGETQFYWNLFTLESYDRSTKCTNLERIAFLNPEIGPCEYGRTYLMCIKFTLCWIELILLQHRFWDFKMTLKSCRHPTTFHTPSIALKLECSKPLSHLVKRKLCEIFGPADYSVNPVKNGFPLKHAYSPWHGFVGVVTREGNAQFLWNLLFCKPNDRSTKPPNATMITFVILK